MYELSTIYNIPIKVTYYKHKNNYDSDDNDDSDEYENNISVSDNNVKHIDYIYDIYDLDINNEYIIIDASNKPYYKGNNNDKYDFYLPYNRLLILPNILPDNLKELYLDNNNIETLDNLPVNLKILSASGNNIDYIKSLPENLVHLNLEKNDITTISIDLPKKLKYLNLNYNLISKLPDKLPSKLEFLSIISNNLKQIPVLSRTLINLHIDFNHIRNEDINFSLYPNLIYFSNSDINDI